MQKLSRRFAALIAVSALAVGALAGCAPEAAPPRWTDSPEIAGEPLFASDEEALAAAEAIYAAYQEMSNQIVREGGAQSERIKPFVTAELFPSMEEAFAPFVTEKWHGEGGITFDSSKLQQHVQRDGVANVVVYLCMDVSKARVIDASGVDVTPESRAIRTPLVVSFVTSTIAPQSLQIESSKVWSGDNFC